MTTPERPGHRAALDVLGPLGRADQPLGPLTTYRVGGPAAVAATVTCWREVATVARAAVRSGLPVLVIGRGSNLLVADRGFDGIAVLVAGTGSAGVASLAEVSPGPRSGGRARVTAGAAVALPTLARRTAAAGLRGLEWAVGVPGSVGGGVRMNAGGHGSDIAATLLTATVADLTAWPEGADRPVTADLDLDDLAFGYRRSSIRSTDLVLAATFTVTEGDAEDSGRTIRDIVAWRREHQPGGQNAGSVFTNPEGDSAGRLIEAAGQKGRRRGSAMVSAKHANFIQADPGGSADDVRALIDEVSASVADHSGVRLTTEVRMIGFRS